MTKIKEKIANITSKDINYNILVFFMFLSPIVDVINSFMQRSGGVTLSIGVIFKGIFLSYLFYYFIFKVKNNKYKKYFLIYLGLVFIWGILFFLNRFSYLNLSLIIQEGINLFKVFYIVIILGLLYFYCIGNKFKSESIKKLFNISFFMYLILLFIPFLTNSGFSSYGYNESGGFVGWFYSANEISVIMLLIIFLIINNSFTNKKGYLFPIMLYILLTLQIGTKVTVLGLFLILLFYLLKSIFKLEGKNVIYLGIIILFSLFISFNGFISDNINSLLDRKDEMKENIDKENNNKVDKDKNNNSNNNNYTSSLINLVLSGRYEYFKDTLKIYNKVDLKTKLIGMGYTNVPSINNSKIEKLIEIDLLDIYFHCGLIGFIIFLIPFIFIIVKNLIILIKNKFFNFDILSCFFILGLILGISTTAGHILAAPSVATFLALYIILLILYTNEYRELKENKNKSKK